MRAGQLVQLLLLDEKKVLRFKVAVMGVPVVGIVDTNGDPSLAIFGNDDAAQSVLYC